ncbi:tRNA 2-selenouridine(34) synthase MnmH [Alkalihalobacillus deserti]|uniref:tRNA 2-selenouridine(34) synthase MnmH n=1 Tax=Alkalihalobacillus deserti TaxID=2879466 RepID=UPI001D1541D0|nr:tRNA 2-selenouridine(34) synthase MnmH [Alkalihalobacillus deserti]
MTRKLDIPTVDIHEALKEDAIFVDVRSPKEFEEFHIPSAINIPLFNNEERIEVGTIYHQKGSEQAKDLGVKILSEKLPDLHATFKELHQNNANTELVMYCWRGGMRSYSLASVMVMLGLPVVQLNGGIRSFRKFIVRSFKADTHATKNYIVLEGLTGTRKTDILSELQNEGYPVIDIEGLANHRGSVFGGIGLIPVSQKEFESRLWSRLEQLKDSAYVIIEAESKRIGNVMLPEFMLKGKERGYGIHLEAAIDFRVKTICETYSFEEFHDEFREALFIIKKRLPTEVFSSIITSFDQKNYSDFVSCLLTEYYDPRYEHSFDESKNNINIYMSTLSQGYDAVKQSILKIQEKNMETSIYV